MSKGNVLHGDNGEILVPNAPNNILQIYNGKMNYDALPFFAGWGDITPAAGTVGTPSLLTRGYFNGLFSTQQNGNPTTADTQGANYATAATNGAVASVYQTSLNLTGNLKNVCFWRFKLPVITVGRFFIGITDQVSATAGSASDAPNIGHEALQYCPGRGDTKWKFSRQAAAAGSQTLVDTNVAPSTSEKYLLCIARDGTGSAYYLFDSTFTLLWSTSVTTNIIDNATPFGMRFLVETLENVAKSFTVHPRGGAYNRA